MIEHASCVVQHITVQLAQRDDSLQGMAQRVVRGNEKGEKKRQRTPAERGNGLHAQDKCVLRQISRVGQGVFLPQLS